MGKASRVKKERVEPAPLKLDFGCGPDKRAGFHGVDRLKFDAVDTVLDIANDPWPWAENSVDEAHASHFVEHLAAVERVQFVNKLWRVLKPGAQCQIIVPHWASNRAYGDPTHQWPPVSEMWFYYLSREWRLKCAPHTDVTQWPHGFDCHFACTWGYSVRTDLLSRSEDARQFAMANYKEAAQDTIAMLTKMD